MLLGNKDEYIRYYLKVQWGNLSLQKIYTLNLFIMIVNNVFNAIATNLQAYVDKGFT
jgi:hypothetical protein